MVFFICQYSVTRNNRSSTLVLTGINLSCIPDLKMEFVWALYWKMDMVGKKQKYPGGLRHICSERFRQVCSYKMTHSPNSLYLGQISSKNAISRAHRKTPVQPTEYYPQRRKLPLPGTISHPIPNLTTGGIKSRAVSLWPSIFRLRIILPSLLLRTMATIRALRRKYGSVGNPIQLLSFCSFSHTAFSGSYSIPAIYALSTMHA